MKQKKRYEVRIRGIYVFLDASNEVMRRLPHFLGHSKRIFRMRSTHFSLSKSTWRATSAPYRRVRFWYMPTKNMTPNFQFSKKTRIAVDSSTELDICSLGPSYQAQCTLKSHTGGKGGGRATLHYRNHLEWDLTTFALFRRILTYKTTVYVYISIFLILWFLACFNYELTELCTLRCY